MFSSSYLTPQDNQSTLFDAITSQDIINLNVGAPSQDLLNDAAELYSKAFQQSKISTLNPSFFQYGPQQGHSEALLGLSQFLSKEYSSPVSPQNLLFTNGCSQALFNTISLFSRPDTVILLAQPTYFLALNVIRDLPISYKTFSVPLQPYTTDISIEALENYLTAHPRKLDSNKFPYIFYLIPTFANPHGGTISLENRLDLINLAYKHNVLLVCDDVYDLLSYPSLSTSLSLKQLFSSPPTSSSTPLPPRLVSLDKKSGRVLSLGTFSKIYAPGSRLGWIEAQPDLINHFTASGLLASGGGSVQLSSILFPTLLPLLHSHLNHLRTVYSSRLLFTLKCLHEASLETNPLLRDSSASDTKSMDGFHIIQPRSLTSPQPIDGSGGIWGGFFIWIRLPIWMDATQLRSRALASRCPVGFAPGKWFDPVDSIPGPHYTYDNYIRLSFAFYPETGSKSLQEGIKRLSTVILSYAQELNAQPKSIPPPQFTGENLINWDPSKGMPGMY